MKNTKNVQSTVLVGDIPAIVADPARGVVSLVGDQGGLSQITGPMDRSGLVMGTLSIETEHGVVYLDPEETTEISEEFPLSEDHPWIVAWKIDTTAPSPEEAAAKVWRDVFGRNVAGPEDACTFTVMSTETFTAAQIDLSNVMSEDQANLREPSDHSYALLGRYVAVLLGANEEWDSCEDTSDMAAFARSVPGFPKIGGQSDEELVLWRGLADQMGIHHDGDGEADEEDSTDTDSQG